MLALTFDVKMTVFTDFFDLIKASLLSGHYLESWYHTVTVGSLSIFVSVPHTHVRLFIWN